MKVVVEKDVFAKVLKYVSMFRSEALWEVKDCKMRTRVVDLANVAMTEVEIPTVSADGEGTFAVDVNALANKVSKLGAKEIELEIGDGMLILKSGKSKYKTALLSEDAIKKPIEIKIDLDTKITLLGSEFKEIVAIAKDIGDTITLERGRMLAHGDTESFELDVDGQGEGKATYCADWFEVVTKVVEKADVVEIDYATNKPCRITVANDEIVAKVYVAPRVEED